MINYSYVMNGASSVLGKRIQLQENCKKLCPVCTKALWEVLHSFWWIRISINKISRAKTERQTFPEMSRCRREGKHNGPVHSRKLLSNTSNKAQLIKMLSQYLKNDRNEVINCSGDADSNKKCSKVGILHPYFQG